MAASCCSLTGRQGLAARRPVMYTIDPFGDTPTRYLTPLHARSAPSGGLGSPGGAAAGAAGAVTAVSAPEGRRASQWWPSSQRMRGRRARARGSACAIDVCTLVRLTDSRCVAWPHCPPPPAPGRGRGRCPQIRVAEREQMYADDASEEVQNMTYFVEFGAYHRHQYPPDFEFFFKFEIHSGEIAGHLRSRSHEGWTPNAADEAPDRAISV